jgi:IS1 family transposase
MNNFSHYSVTDRIRFIWSRLTEQEVAYYETDHRKFTDAVQRKYGLSSDEIAKQIKALESDPRIAA